MSIGDCTESSLSVFAFYGDRSQGGSNEIDLKSTYTTQPKMVHPDFHWPNIFATIFHEFHRQFFLQWLHLNNLCRESIAQDWMQVSQIFRDGYI